MNLNQVKYPNSNIALKKAIKDNVNLSEIYYREEKFRQGWSKKVMRNKKTGVIYLVSVANEGFYFEPTGNSTRKPFYKESCENYEEAGTGLNN